MIKNVIIEGLYDKEVTTLSIKNKLTLLTGDNGSGKTTLLNLVYNVLSGEFVALFNVKFQTIVVEFNDNKRALKKIIVVKERTKMYIKYITDEYFRIDIEKNPFVEDYNFAYIKENENKSEEEEEEVAEEVFWGHNISSIMPLIYKHSELEFIVELKNSILYFPTYRRIESDLKMLELSRNVVSYKEVGMRFKDTRIVMGINNDEITSIYNTYSNKIRKFNSESLNELLKRFIKNLINSIGDENENLIKNQKITDYNLAIENLFDLVEKLGIKDGINKEVIKDYFKRYELKEKNLSQIDKEIKANKQKAKKSIETSSRLKTLLEIIKMDNNNMDLIINLIHLYGEHLSEQSAILDPVLNLKKVLNSFFKDKLELKFNEKNYAVNLSTDFDLLSTGEKQLITLLSFIFLTMSDSVFNPLVIIDEPELSLHISWQKKLLPNLNKLTKSTFLIATHSPYIANINYIDSVNQLGVIDEYK